MSNERNNMKQSKRILKTSPNSGGAGKSKSGNRSGQVFAAESLTKENFADLAEKVIVSLIDKDKNGNNKIGVTTNKIRNLLALSNALYTRAVNYRNEKLDENFVSDIKYMKVRFAYEAGRDADVKKFVDRTKLIQYTDKIGNSREQLLIFCRYMESLVAFHKYYGGKDR